jgi:hypothetical protein
VSQGNIPNYNAQVVLGLCGMQALISLSAVVSFYDDAVPGAGLGTLFLGKWNAFTYDSVTFLTTVTFIHNVPTKE